MTLKQDEETYLQRLLVQAHQCAVATPEEVPRVRASVMDQQILSGLDLRDGFHQAIIQAVGWLNRGGPTQPLPDSVGPGVYAALMKSPLVRELATLSSAVGTTLLRSEPERSPGQNYAFYPGYDEPESLADGWEEEWE